MDQTMAGGPARVVVVSTDDAEIAATARAAGAEVVDRPAELAGHTATSETAVLHAIDRLARTGRAPDATVLVQCTSPFIDTGDLTLAVERVLDPDGYDKLYSRHEDGDLCSRR